MLKFALKMTLTFSDCKRMVKVFTSYLHEEERRFSDLFYLTMNRASSAENKITILLSSVILTFHPPVQTCDSGILPSHIPIICFICTLAAYNSFESAVGLADKRSLPPEAPDKERMLQYPSLDSGDGFLTFHDNLWSIFI